jgi:hypothetical protein
VTNLSGMGPGNKRSKREDVKMETAKVDLRKLQLLNDRIAQVIDALNQVRFSVHGLSHTTPGFAPNGVGYNSFPWQGQVSPFGGFAGQVPMGLSHTGELSHDPYARAREEQRIAQEMALRYGNTQQFGTQQFGGQQFSDPRFSPGFGYGWNNGTPSI